MPDNRSKIGNFLSVCTGVSEKFCSILKTSFSLERVNKLTELIIPLDRSILYLFLVYKKFIEFIILLALN